jgi:hypothetical protein
MTATAWMRVTVDDEEFLGLTHVIEEWVNAHMFTPPFMQAIDEGGGIFVTLLPPEPGKTGSAWFSPSYAVAARDLLARFKAAPSDRPKKREVALLSGAGDAWALLD